MMKMAGGRLCSRRDFVKASAAAAITLSLETRPSQVEAGVARSGEPITPGDEIVHLFNGRDLKGLYSWLKDTQYSDPRRVFTVVNGLLQISGEVDGYIATERPYKDYHLVVEYKWGTRTYGHKTVRNSG